MNRFFRRLRAEPNTSSASKANHDGDNHDEAKPNQAAPPKEQTPPVQNTDANFALSSDLSSDKDTPKTLTLTTPEPSAAKLHTATPTAPATEASAPEAAATNKVAAANEPATDKATETAAAQEVAPKPAEAAAPSPQVQPEAQAAPASGKTPEQAAAKSAEKAPEKADPQFALSGEADTPKTLTLTTPTPSNAALHTATPTDAHAPAKSQPQAKPQPAVATPIAVPQQATQSKGAMNSTNGKALIQLNDVIKAYQTPVGEFVALRGINLAIGRGEFVAVVGKSGSGKSTLINMITGIDRPSSGEIFIENTPIHNLAEGPMAEWRGRNVGIIFQFFQLLPMLSCIENVMLPMDFCNMFKPSERESRALHLLEQVDMVEHAYKLPSEVSGGQQQRVAIARALANDPPLLVADEPTGNLDSRTADAVFQLFAQMVDDGKTILMVTHDDEMAHQVRRTITLTDGQIVDQQYHTQHASAPTAPNGEAETPVADAAAVGV